MKAWQFFLDLLRDFDFTVVLLLFDIREPSSLSNADPDEIVDCSWMKMYDLPVLIVVFVHSY